MELFRHTGQVFSSFLPRLKIHTSERLLRQPFLLRSSMLKIFNFLRVSEADAVLIAEIRKMLRNEILPQQTKEKTGLLSVNKVTRIIERATKKVLDHKNEQKMGRIRWLNLINELRWSLHEEGYSKDFVALVSEAVIAKSVVKKQTET